MAIYLDYNATQPLNDAASASIVTTSAPGLSGLFGNASSSHVYGRAAQSALQKARSQVAALINASPDEVSFCSGATESVNHIVKAAVFSAWRDAGRVPVRVVVSAIEHYATDRALQWLEDYGFATRITVPVQSDGRVDASAFALAAEGACLACCMLANNETGAVQPVAEIAERLRRAGDKPLLFCDASQAAGKVPVDVRALGVDLLCLAGHKLGAPKGTGATFVRTGVVLEPLLHGAGQEGGRRSGTDNVVLAVAFGAAAEAAAATCIASARQLSTLRDALARNLFRRCTALGVTPVVHGPLGPRYSALARDADTAALAPLDGCLAEGAAQDVRALPSCLPQTLYIAFPGAFSGDLMKHLAGSVACSAGAACHSSAGGSASTATISHTLEAMGVSHELGTATLRLSLGKWTTMDDLDRAAVKIAEAVEASLNTQAAIALAVPATEMTPTSQGTAVLAPLPVQSTPRAAPAVATAPLYLDDTELYSCSAELLASLRGTAEGLVVISQGSQSADSGVLQSWGPTVAPYTHALVVSRSVAHPQGGGQPSDRGIIVVRIASGQPRVFEFGLVKHATGIAAPPGATLHYGYWREFPADASESWLDLLSPSAQAAANTIAPSSGTIGASSSLAPEALLPGAQVTVHISATIRRLAARLHSAGHLLDLAVKRVLQTHPATSGVSLSPGKGYHFFDGAFVEYSGAVPSPLREDLPALLNAECAAIIAASEPTRVWTTATASTGICTGSSSSVTLESLGVPQDQVSHLPPGSSVRIVAVGAPSNVCPCGGTHVRHARDIGGIRVTSVRVKKGTTKVTYEIMEGMHAA